MRNIINKKFNKGVLVGATIATMLLALVGCGKTKTANVNTSTDATTEATNTPTDATNNVDNNLDTNDTFVPGDLDIDSNESIENQVDAIYEANSEWYDYMGMDKDEIRDLIFIANDKYTDEDGNLIIDEDRAAEAYSNIERIMGNSGVQEYSPILQKIDNINTIEEEGNSEIGLQVQEENNWKIIEYPSLTQYIDINKAGGKATVKKLEEFEALRDYEIKAMNETGKYDRDRINDFVIDMEITNYNTNGGNIGGINKNGQEYMMAAYKDAALQFAAKANPNVIYLEGYEGISENIKINKTNEERFLENDIIDMTTNGTLDAATVDSVINEIKGHSEVKENGLAYTGEEQELLEKYALTNDQLRLIMSYTHYLTTMADHKYKEVECDEENETYEDIATKRADMAFNETVFIENNRIKKLTLC